MASFKDKISQLPEVDQSAIHELYLEGIEVTEDLLDELLLLERKQISGEEFLKRAVDRVLSKDE